MESNLQGARFRQKGAILEELFSGPPALHSAGAYSSWDVEKFAVNRTSKSENTSFVEIQRIIYSYSL